MDESTHIRAQKIISTLQTQLNDLRQGTYKAVHDDIGSTLSTASIKTKILVDKISNEVDKHHLQEIHKMIRETLDQVTTLNKNLKSVWIPQSTDTFFESLENEFALIQQSFPLQLKLEVYNRSKLKKQNLTTLAVMHDCVHQYLKNTISRLANTLTILVKITSDQIEWSFTDTSPCKPVIASFQDIIEKISPVSGVFTIHESKTTLTFPNQGVG
jgi:glucose-6-phosphate-specific signal transduction histidine kinase